MGPAVVPKEGRYADDRNGGISIDKMREGRSVCEKLRR